MTRPPCPKCWRRIRRPDGADPAGLCWCCSPKAVMPTRLGTVTPRVVRMAELRAMGWSYSAIGREVGVVKQSVANALRGDRPAVQRVLREDHDLTANMSAEQLDALEARQRKRLPSWWEKEMPKSRPPLSPGRCATPVRTKVCRVVRKGRK